MKESEAYHKLRPFLARLFAVDRVENAILPGMPDVIISRNDKTTFVEMKAKIGKHLRGSQVAWCLRRKEKECFADMFVLTYNGMHWHIFWMAEVAENGGLVSLDLAHVVYVNPELVAQFFYSYMFNPKEVAHDIRRRVGESES